MPNRLRLRNRQAAQPWERLQGVVLSQISLPQDRPEESLIKIKAVKGASGSKIKGQRVSAKSVSFKSADDDPQAHVQNNNNNNSSIGCLYY